MGGDFQFAPLRLARRGFARRLGARIVAPEGAVGTVRKPMADDNVIDYFVVSRGPALAGARAEVDIDTEAAPHRPVSLRVAIAGRNVPQLVVAKVSALERIIGPAQQPAAAAGRLVA